MDRAIATPSQIKGEMSPEVKRTVKTTPTIHNQVNGRTMSAAGVSQNQPLATARLSAECQLRRFNPKWYETSSTRGFKCSVQLMNKVINGDRVYPTAFDAKQAAAEKALIHVRRQPCEDPAEKAAARIRQTESGDYNRIGRASVKREPSANANHASIHGQYAYATPADANAAAYNWNAYGYTGYAGYNTYNEHRVLLHRIQSLFGGPGPSQAVVSNPMAAQAFLQGLALGTSIRAASSAYDAYLEPQGGRLPVVSGEVYRPYEPRERSPAPSVSRNYRDRSSPRRHTSYESNAR
ncbi:hypothetical protein F4678DRAFT_321144 [Xylaria arbuscula]|nr:hypothetical protein F4678DRAFT_321144 [Xylaria arbuscula]